MSSDISEEKEVKVESTVEAGNVSQERKSYAYEEVLESATA